MGQDINFEKIDSGDNSTHIYKLNRSLTGMEIVSYSDIEFEVDENNGAAVLAKLLLEQGVETISIYSNVVTITCDSDKFSKIRASVENIMSNLFRFYGDEAVWSKVTTS